MKDAAGIIRGWEDKGGILIGSAEQKKVFQWFDTISPEERLYWYKRVLALPFSRPQIRVLEYDHRERCQRWRLNSYSPETKTHFFTLTAYIRDLCWGCGVKDVSNLYDHLSSARIIMNPLTPTAWEPVGNATLGPPYKAPEGPGVAYVFAMSFLDAMSPLLEKDAEIIQWLRDTPIGQSEEKIRLPYSLQVFCKRKENYAYHIYQNLLKQCVPVTQEGLASVETFFAHP